MILSVTELHSQYCIKKRMHNHVSVSDGISLICTVLYTEVLKNQLLTWQIEYSTDPDNSNPR